MVDYVPRLKQLKDRLRPTMAQVAAKQPTSPKQPEPAPFAMQGMMKVLENMATTFDRTCTTLKAELTNKMDNSRLAIEASQNANHNALVEAIKENTKAIKDQTAKMLVLETKVDANSKNIDRILSIPHITSSLCVQAQQPAFSKPQMKPPPHPPQPAPGEKGGAAPLVRSRLSQSLNRDNRRSSLSPSPSRGTNMDDQMVTDPHKGEKRPRSPPAGTGTATGGSDATKPEPKAKKAIDRIYYDRHKEDSTSEGSQRSTKHKYTHVQV